MILFLRFLPNPGRLLGFASALSLSALPIRACADMRPAPRFIIVHPHLPQPQRGGEGALCQNGAKVENGNATARTHTTWRICGVQNGGREAWEGEAGDGPISQP